jgi:hypothetical protein
VSWAAPQAGIRAIDDALAFVGLDLAKAAASSPLTRRGFDALVRALVTAMQSGAAAPTASALRAATQRLDHDWPRLTESQREEAFRHATLAIASSVARIASAASAPIEHAAHGTIEATRQATARSASLSIPDVFGVRDITAAQFARTSAGFYMRTTGGAIITGAADKAARGVVARAIEEGWDRADTGAELERALAGTIAARTRAYYEMVASVAIARARSWSQLRSFEDAGITSYRFQSVLDEVTSAMCRFMHGRVFDVRETLRRYEQVSLGAPEDVVDLQPFMQLGRRADGSQVLFASTGGERVEIAEVLRSAVGRKDEVGSYRVLLGDDKLQKLGCCQPPLHPHCRSTIVPGPTRWTSVPTGISTANAPPGIAPPTPPAPAAAAPPRRRRGAVPPATAAPILPAPSTIPLSAPVHFAKLVATAAKRVADATLKRLGLPWIRDLLSMLPLDTLELRRSMASANGSYLARREGTLALNLGRGKDTFGVAFTPGASWSISSAARDLSSAVTRTFVHEIGHHIHMRDAPSTPGLARTIDMVVRKSFANGNPITRYGRSSRHEYFAESLAAYVFERAALTQHDPVGLAMVETVLAMRGMKTPL